MAGLPRRQVPRPPDGGGVPSPEVREGPGAPGRGAPAAQAGPGGWLPGPDCWRSGQWSQG
eukprot:14855702-Alexandrium_andersonii.AAC.1